MSFWFFFFGGILFGGWLYLTLQYNEVKHDIHPRDKKTALDSIRAFALIIVIIFWIGYIL
jgi:hypothetical protein